MNDKGENKDRIVSGILNIYKPQEMTSHDVIAIIRKASGVRKAGHTGTLDPMATGVLPVCLGSAARIMEYLDADMKVYRCSMRLGYVSDTNDIWGEVSKSGDPAGITDEEINETVSRYCGRISQIPPVYSALKVNGRKLYEYARSGQDVDVKAREIYIENIVTENVSREADIEVTFTVTCSKGTYVRSLCRDIGEDLGCGAVMSSLERKASGIFQVEDAVDIEKIRNMEPKEIEDLLIPADNALSHFGKGLVREERVKAFLNGLSVYAKDVKIEKAPAFSKEDLPFYADSRYTAMYCLYGCAGGGQESPEFLGAAAYDEETDSFKPDKVFFKAE